MIESKNALAKEMSARIDATKFSLTAGILT
jgi:hypothetical protein